MVVSDHDTTIRQYRFSRDLLRKAVGGALLLFAVVIGAGARYAVVAGPDARLARLAQENTLLRQELSQIEARSGELTETLAKLSERDRAFRLVAGLEPIPTDVLAAGVGGPGMATAEETPLYEVAPVTAREAFGAEAKMESLLRRARILVSSWTEATTTLQGEHDRLAATPSILPARGWLTSGFSLRRVHPILHVPRPHEGLDIAAATGTPIHAAADGIVRYSGPRGDYGNMVEIDHGHGYVTRYAHASKLLVERGERVERGQKIAEVGSTGLSVGPHVHYEVVVNGRAKNPTTFILKGDAIPD